MLIFAARKGKKIVEILRRKGHTSERIKKLLFDVQNRIEITNLESFEN